MTNAEKVKEFTSNKTVKKYHCLELETENGIRIIERHPMKEMKGYLKEYFSNEYVDDMDEDAIYIMYKDGTFLNVEETKGVKLTNIKGVIFENSATTAYAGEGIEIVDYNELYEDWGGEDWRVEFIS